MSAQKPAPSPELALQARRVYVDTLVRGMVPLGAHLGEAAQALLLLPAEYAVQQQRRDVVEVWRRCGVAWQAGVVSRLRQASIHGAPEPRSHAEAPQGEGGLTLVAESTIEREISGSRLALAMMDKATWEFSDLRTRMQVLEGIEDLPERDLMRAQTLAGLVQEAWQASGMGQPEWQVLQSALHDEFAHLLGEAYHDTNHWLMSRQVCPEVDLRPFIRRSVPASVVQQSAASLGGAAPAALSAAGTGPASSGPIGQDYSIGRSPVSAQAQEVLEQLQRVLTSEVPGLQAGSAASPDPKASGDAGAPRTALRDLPAAPRTLSARLNTALGQAQALLAPAYAALPSAEGAVLSEGAAAEALEQLRERNQAFKQALKQAADTPAERATIEVVALLFQSILTEDRIPSSIRVWFARLQMPVLRVAVSEPDFFAATDHPARRLIDRMGACVMGFSASSSAGVSEALEREVKRVVQVVEAYPDTGRRVFQTVLTEFERFLDNYFEHENQTTRKGVSLAQQVEQRETLAIQYTIELRKMLNAVPVQDGIRDFLFQVWADVLAVTALRSGAQSAQTKQMQRAAADLIWSASAKVSREERAEVIRRLPPLLKTLREGMVQLGFALDRQDEQIRSLNAALAAAFSAKSAAIPRERLDGLMGELEALDAMLPDSEGLELSEAMVRDLSGHESEDLEVVADGGAPASAAMLAWAGELQVGGWFMLDYRGRNEAVQLAWRGLRHQLVLFVSPQGRGVLFQLNRLAAFLQAGLLLPAQDEALTVKATRKALAKLEVDPTRLLS